MRTSCCERSPALQVLDQREQRPLAGVQRDEVEVVEHARFVQLAQLGVAVAAAEHRDDCGSRALDGLRDAERAVDVARERAP